MKEIRDAVESVLGEAVASFSAVGGGCITVNNKITTISGRMFFLKTGGRGRMFPCEANGLKELARAKVLRVPKVVAVADDFLLTEYIRPGTRPQGFFGEFGRGLARLHQNTSETFGFYEDNFIGTTPQPNVCSGNEARNWVDFYLDKRLLYQYRLAEQNGYASERLKAGFHNLESRTAAILEGSDEPPCLLHGDLWSGNYVCDESGQPVLIDPAVYYGHREADLAMTRLFGGFPQEFYEAYDRENPLQTGWQRRENLYRLYHVLNHLNLFGGEYLYEAERLVEGYLS